MTTSRSSIVLAGRTWRSGLCKAPAALLSISASFAMLCHSAQATPPDTIQITGTVRDFMKSHSDFNVTPAGGNGHIAGLVPTTVNGNLPMFSAGGFKVATQWRDQQSHNIPPHLAGGSGTSLSLMSAPSLDQGAYIDGWNPAQGPYGQGNSGPSPGWQQVGSIPPVSPPDMTGVPYVASIGTNQWMNTVQLNADVYAGTITSKQNAVIVVNGHRTIYCTGNMTLGKFNDVRIMSANSSLKIYVGGNFTVSQGTTMNMVMWQPALLKIYMLGNASTQLVLNQNTQVCAQIVSPQAQMIMHQNDHLYGSLLGASLEMHQSCGFHATGQSMQMCGQTVNDILGAAGMATTGGIASASSFAQWFQDSMGSNLSMSHSITLTRNASGVYEYITDSFLPIDGQLFGNEGDAHNYHFTFAFSADFVYQGCQQPRQYIEFMGADDAWTIIDGKLGLDVGGVMPLTTQRLEIDRLGLVSGQTYTLHFFYAQRNPTAAVFHLTTNIELQGATSVANLSVTAAYD